MQEQKEVPRSKPQEYNGVILTAIGNPVVDVVVMVPDAQFFIQHNMPVDGQRPESAVVMTTLQKDIKLRNYKTMVFPGGCAQNTTRVFQWLMNTEFQSCMIGSIGNDDEGRFLEDRLKVDGVKPCFLAADDWPTYSLLVFVHGHSRFIVYPADNDSWAVAKYSMSCFLGHADAIQSIEKSHFAFIEGFFSEHSPQVALKMLDMCVELGIVTSFNICAVAVVEENFQLAVEPFLRKCSVVVGNTEEFVRVCEKVNVSVASTTQAMIDVHKVMMSSVPCTQYRVESMRRYKKILIVTDGDKDVHCVSGSDGLVHYVPPPIEHDKIRDTTGAGDAFIAGFLYGLMNDQPTRKCLEIGCRVAGLIIQQYGVTIPKERANFLDDDNRP